MQIPWEASKQLVAGSKAAAYQDVDGVFHLIYSPEGTRQPHIVSAEVPLGVWDPLTFSDPIAIAPDNNLVSINIFNQPDDNVWIVWETDKQHRIAVIPDTGEIYDPESVYRLYYAVDTEIMYMNISEIWTPVGSPNLAKLVGFKEVDDRIKALENPAPPAP
jgi:hypothetical protein